jgi:hypothetical protein
VSGAFLATALAFGALTAKSFREMFGTDLALTELSSVAAWNLAALRRGD